eukprot:scaffold147063_cov68-Cyclotella_meneghiniana.AAC.4
MPVFLVVAAAAIHQYIRHRQNEASLITKTPDETAGDEISSINITHDTTEPAKEVIEIPAPSQEEHAIFDTVINCCGADIINGAIMNLSPAVKVHPAGESEETSSESQSSSTDEPEKPDASAEKLNDDRVSLCENYSSDKEQNIQPLDADYLTKDYYYQRLPTEETEEEEDCNHYQDNSIQRKFIKKPQSRKNNSFKKRWEIIRVRFFQPGMTGEQFDRGVILEN